MTAFALSPEHEELRASLRRFAEDQLAPHAAEVDERAEFPWKSFEANRVLGVHPDPVPGRARRRRRRPARLRAPRRGGRPGLRLVVAVRHHQPPRLRPPILAYGSPELQAAVVPRIVAGDWQGSYCLSEPNAGSDVASMSTRAVRDGDHYVLNGRKVWITNAGVSDVYTVFAKTDPDAGSKGISAFVVERDTPGFSIGKLETKLGVRGSPTGEILLDDVVVPAERRIGDENAAFGYAMQALNGSRPIIGAPSGRHRPGGARRRDPLRHRTSPVRQPHRRLPGYPVPPR